MFLIKTKDDLEEGTGKLSCTTEIQAVFILSPTVIFFCGFLILFISRFIRRSFNKWKKSKGIFLVSSPVTKIRDRFGLCLCLEDHKGITQFSWAKSCGGVT